MLALDIITSETHASTRGRELAIVSSASRRSSYYVAFLDLVRRQLRRDYAEADLNEAGLRIYTTLDPTAQAAAESSLVRGLDALQPDRPILEGAVIITNPHNAEVRAVVGSRRTGFDGFNRALDAKRQVGSLIKPVIYLAALESGNHSLATIIDDEAIEVPLDNGRLGRQATSMVRRMDR